MRLRLAGEMPALREDYRAGERREEEEVQRLKP